GVLHAAIRIDEFRADAANSREKAKSNHLHQPIGLEDLDVVVEEEQHFAGRGTRADITSLRIIKSFRVSDDADALCSGEFFVISKDIRIGAFVIDEDDFYVRIIGMMEKAIYASAQHGDVVDRWNDNAHQRRP